MAVPLITDNKACETLLSFMCTYLYSNQTTWNHINITRLTTYLLEAENTINKQGILVALNDIDLGKILNINNLISPAIIDACIYALHDTDLLTSNLAAQSLFMIGENLENNHLHHYLDDLGGDTLERFISSMESEENFIGEKATELTALMQYENNFAALASWLASHKAEATSTSATDFSANCVLC